MEHEPSSRQHEETANNSGYGTMPVTPDGLLDLDRLHEESDYAAAIREFPDLDYSRFFQPEGQPDGDDRHSEAQQPETASTNAQPRQDD